MKRLLIAITSGLFVLLNLNSEVSKPLKAQSLLKSCLNYPYDLGIDLKQNRNGSFRLLSTSIANIKINNASFISRALREANLKARLNISDFIKLNNSLKSQHIKEIGFPIRINGKSIKTKTQLNNKLKKLYIQSSQNLKGVKQIAKCNQLSNNVMVTLEITNETISAAEYIETRSIKNLESD